MLTYPVFVIAKDDLSIDLIESERKLRGWYEQIDVEDNDLYEGWDAQGIPFKLEWQKDVGVIPKLVSNIPEKDKRREALLTYAKQYGPKAPFVPPDTNDMGQLMQAIKSHVQANKLSFWEKLRRKHKQ